MVPGDRPVADMAQTEIDRVVPIIEALHLSPIWFGAGYVKLRTWWWLGLIVSIPNILIWTGVGFLWWKLLGWI